MRIILKVLAAFALLAVPFVLATFLFVLCFLALGIGSLVRRYGYRHEWSLAFWWGFLLVATVLVMVFKLWPKPSVTARCSTSPLPLLGYLAQPAPYVRTGDTNLSRSQVDIYLQSFDQRRFELLQSAEYSEEGFSRVQDGYRVLNGL